MKIGIDSRSLQNDSVFRGIGRYVISLIDALRRVGDPSFALEILLDETPPRGPEGTLLCSVTRVVGGLVVRHVHLHHRHRLPFVRSRSIRQALAPLDLDLYHVPDQSCLFKSYRIPTPYVVTVHDLTPFVTFGGGTFERRLRRRWKLRALRSHCRRAGAVIVDAAHTRSDCERLLGIPAERIDVVPLGVDACFRPGERPSEGTLARLGIRGPYFLYVGGYESHKNVGAIIEAHRIYRSLHSVRDELVLAGRRQPGHAGLGNEGGNSAGVRFTGFVAEEDMPGLYRGATALMTLSRSEGFCLPAIEAMACGTPVIASACSVFPETVGDAGILVDPDDPGMAAKAMAQVAGDATVAADLRARGLARAARFTWDRTARETLAVYRRVIGRSRMSGQ